MKLIVRCGDEEASEEIGEDQKTDGSKLSAKMSMIEAAIWFSSLDPRPFVNSSRIELENGDRVLYCSTKPRTRENRKRVVAKVLAKAIEFFNRA